MAFYAFTDPDNGYEYGSFETFEITPADVIAFSQTPGAIEYEGPGWYWRACFPGCMPDSEPFGPFESESAAATDAREA